MVKATHHFDKMVALKLSPQVASFLWACMNSMVEVSDDRTTIARAKVIMAKLEKQMCAVDRTAKP